MIDLLPCPFCGGSDIRVNGSRSSFVQCGGCGAESRAEDDDRAAIAAWNRRADDWQPSWGDLVAEAQKIVEDKTVFRRFIDGPPLSNDVAVWMADFALMVKKRMADE